MKKKILFSLVALSLIVISCNEESHMISDENAIKTESVQKNARFTQLPQSEKQRIATEFFSNLGKGNNYESKTRGFCHPFKVTAGIGIFTVETTISVCCTTLTMNCIPVPDVVIHKKTGEPTIEEFEILDSSIYENEDGTKIRIKKGVYDVSSGYLQLELEELK